MPAGVIIKPGTLNVSRHNCFRVVMQNLRPDHPNYGKWEPISRCGFTVVATSKLEAEELVIIVGSGIYPCPEGMTSDDDRYIEYLKRRMLIQPHEATGKYEVLFRDWIRGWVPDANEMTTGIGESFFAQMIQPILEATLMGKDA